MLQLGSEENTKHTWLRLERISKDCFQGDCDSETPEIRAFGGQVLAQAVACAYLTVKNGFLLAGLHCYFIRGAFHFTIIGLAEEKKPIIYTSKVLRSGQTFAFIRIYSTQLQKPILSVDIIFQRLNVIARNNPRISLFPSNIPAPEQLASSFEERNNLLENGVEPLFAGAQRIERFAPYFEMRPCDPLLFTVGVPSRNYTNFHGEDLANEKPRKQYFWARYNVRIENSQKLSHCVLTALSDLTMAKTGTLMLDPPKAFNLLTSLDHSLWMHDFNVDPNDWLLYEQECYDYGCERSLVVGKIWSRDGRLIATSAQDVLVQINTISEDASKESTLRIAAFHSALSKNSTRQNAKI